jgi:hypothetical protein
LGKDILAVNATPVLQWSGIYVGVVYARGYRDCAVRLCDGDGRDIYIVLLCVVTVRGTFTGA